MTSLEYLIKFAFTTVVPAYDNTCNLANVVHRSRSFKSFIQLIMEKLFFDSSRKEWGAENPSEVVNKFRNYEI